MRLVFCAALRYHVGMNNESIENIASRLAEVVPEGLKAVREDLEQNFRGVLRASLGKLDLVTREEFEVQEAVLAKTRAKLEALEARLMELENGA
jgi:BMFP domain-containing protein YqiC